MTPDACLRAVVTHCAASTPDAASSAALALETGGTDANDVAACARVVAASPSTPDAKAAVDALAATIAGGSTVFGPVAHAEVAATLAAASCAAQFATGAASGADAVAYALASADAATASLAALDRRQLVEAACDRVAQVEARCCRALGALCARGAGAAAGEGWAADVTALACRGRIGDASRTRQALATDGFTGDVGWRPSPDLPEAWRAAATAVLGAEASPLRSALTKTGDPARAVAGAVQAATRDAALLPLALLAALEWSTPVDGIADALDREDLTRDGATLLLACSTTDAHRKRAAGLGAFQRLVELATEGCGELLAAQAVAAKALESTRGRYSFDRGSVAFLDDQGALAVDLEAMASLVEGAALKRLFEEARRVFPLCPAPLLQIVAFTKETATGDLRRVPFGAKVAVCTESAALTLDEANQAVWAPARLDDVSRAAANDALPAEATFTVTSSKGAVALKDVQGQLHAPTLAELLVCVGGCDSVVGGRVPPGSVGAVAHAGAEPDTPLAVRWDAAPRSVVAAAAALCGDAGASAAAKAAARVLAAHITTASDELARPSDADAPAALDALARRAGLGGPGAAEAARAFVEALASGGTTANDAAQAFLGPSGPFSGARAAEAARRVELDGTAALADALCAAATSTDGAAPCCRVAADAPRAAQDVMSALVVLSATVATAKDDRAIDALASCAQALAAVAKKGGESRAQLLDDPRTPQLLAAMLALPLRRAPGGDARSRAAAFAAHGDSLGKTAALRTMTLAALQAAREFPTVPATLAALAASYLRHDGAIGTAACHAVTRALETTDDAWWWRAPSPALAARLSDAATSDAALQVVKAVVASRPAAAAALLPADCAEACVAAAAHALRGAIELYVACAEGGDVGTRIAVQLEGSSTFVDGVLRSPDAIAWRARAALARVNDKVATAPPPALNRAFGCALRVKDVTAAARAPPGERTHGKHRYAVDAPRHADTEAAQGRDGTQARRDAERANEAWTLAAACVDAAACAATLAKHVSTCAASVADQAAQALSDHGAITEALVAAAADDTHNAGASVAGAACAVAVEALGCCKDLKALAAVAGPLDAAARRAGTAGRSALLAWAVSVASTARAAAPLASREPLRRLACVARDNLRDAAEDPELRSACCAAVAAALRLDRASAAAGGAGAAAELVLGRASLVELLGDCRDATSKAVEAAVLAALDRRGNPALVVKPLQAYEAVVAALTQAQLAAPLADACAADAFVHAGRDGVCRALARARAAEGSKTAARLAARLAPPWRSALRLAARAVDAGADVRQAAAFARARAADSYGAFRALDAIGRDAVAPTSVADAAAALDVVSALSRKATEWRRADASGAQAFGAVCVAIVRSAARRCLAADRSLAVVVTAHHPWQSPASPRGRRSSQGAPSPRSGSPRKNSHTEHPVDPAAKAAADQLAKLVAPALGAARRLSQQPAQPRDRPLAVGDRVDVALTTPMTPRVDLPSVTSKPGVVEALDGATVAVVFDDGARDAVPSKLVTMRAPPPAAPFAPFSVGEVDSDEAENAPPSAGHLEVLLRAYAKETASQQPVDNLAREEACVALVGCAVADARARPTAHSRSEAARKADLHAGLFRHLAPPPDGAVVDDALRSALRGACGDLLAAHEREIASRPAPGTWRRSLSRGDSRGRDTGRMSTGR